MRMRLFQIAAIAVHLRNIDTRPKVSWISTTLGWFSAFLEIYLVYQRLLRTLPQLSHSW